MGTLTRLFKGSNSRSYTLDREELVEIFGGQTTAAGVRVNETTALQASAVYACVRAISEDVAKLPLILYRRLADGGKERARDHPLYELLHSRPNETQTAFSFRETMQACLLLYGNAYAYIDRNRAGRPIGLWFIHPSAVMPERGRANNGKYEIIYHVQLENAGNETLSSDYILHIPGLGFDGIKGISVLRWARESIGTFLAAQEYGARFFGNDTTPGMVLVAPRHLSETERQALHQQFRVRYEGASRKFRMAIIDQGWEIKQLGISLDDAQFVQLMQFGVEEIARLFRVPPHKIGHLLRSTYSNIEQQNIEYYTDTLESWLVRWEQVLNTKLLMPDERREYYIEHLMDSILRADVETRYRAYATGIQWGILTPAEVRQRENLNPLNGTQTTWMPVNMMPVGGEGGAEKEEQKIERRSMRSRRKSGPALRHKLALSNKHIFHDAAGRIIRREVNDIKQALGKYLKSRSSQEFVSWLDGYYNDARVWQKQYLMPTYLSYSEAVAAACAEEIGLDQAPMDKVEVVANCMSDACIEHYTALRRNQVKKKLQDAIAANLNVEAEIAGLLERFEEEWPEEYSTKEVIRLGGAIARLVFFSSGITAIVWVAAGQNPCLLCQAMDGTVVGRGEKFANEGGIVEAVDGSSTLTMREDIGHPPLHDGCECVIAPA